MYILLTGNMRNGSLHNVVSLIFIFIFILILAYFSAKLTAKLQGNGMNRKANIKIIESFRLGNGKFISVVQIGRNYYALGFGKDEITLIDKLDSEDIEIPEISIDENKKSFKDIFQNINNKDTLDNIDKK